MTVADGPSPGETGEGRGLRRIFGTRRCTDPQCVGQMLLKGIRQAKTSAAKTEQLWICKVCHREEWEMHDVGLDPIDLN